MALKDAVSHGADFLANAETLPAVPMLEQVSTTLRSLWATGGFARIYAASSMPLNFPILMLGLDAPHGRFAWHTSKLNLNGNAAWLVMELFSPVSFLLALGANGPVDGRAYWPAVTYNGLDGSLARIAALPWPTRLLALAFVTHYTNRSVISTLRQPSARSPIHALPFVYACVFNFANGTLIGSWLAGRTVRGVMGAVPTAAGTSPLFWLGVAMWTVGFLGNVAHDEILRQIRVERKRKQREAERAGKKTGAVAKQPHYAVPHGLLYDAPFGGISAPNYLCEWVEWAGFAIAATAILPPPALPTVQGSIFTAAKRFFARLRTPSITARSPLRDAATYLTPPWLFVIGEVGVMLPRALRSHAWMRDQFSGALPSRRKAVIPGVL